MPRLPGTPCGPDDHVLTQHSVSGDRPLDESPIGQVCRKSPARCDVRYTSFVHDVGAIDSKTAVPGEIVLAWPFADARHARRHADVKL